MKLNREIFNKYYKGKYVLCTTLKQANEYLAFLGSLGFRWDEGQKIKEYNLWERYISCGVYFYEGSKGIRHCCEESLSSTHNLVKYGYHIKEEQRQIKVGDIVEILISELPFLTQGKLARVLNAPKGSNQIRVKELEDPYKEAEWYIKRCDVKRVSKESMTVEKIDKYDTVVKLLPVAIEKEFYIGSSGRIFKILRDLRVVFLDNDTGRWDISLIGLGDIFKSAHEIVERVVPEKPILTEEERNFLSFFPNLVYIQKYKTRNGKPALQIRSKKINNFDSKICYYLDRELNLTFKGLELDKEYTPEQLELTK